MTCIAINVVCVQYNGGFLPDIILLYGANIIREPLLYHEEEGFCPYSQCSHLITKRVELSPCWVNGMFIYPGYQVRWTYQPGSHNRRKLTQDFSSTFLLRCVPEFFSRERFSHSFPSPTVLSNFVVLHYLLVGHFYFFSEIKSRLPGFELTSQRVRRLRVTSELPGRPAR